jgi:hypothetical protein
MDNAVLSLGLGGMALVAVHCLTRIIRAAIVAAKEPIQLPETTRGK